MKGSPHFSPDPDAEILYKAMKGIGEWTSMACYWRTGPLWGFASAVTALRVTVMQRITLMLASPLVVSTDLPTKTGEEDNRCSSLSNRERGGYLLCALVQSGFSHL